MNYRNTEVLFKNTINPIMSTENQYWVIYSIAVHPFLKQRDENGKWKDNHYHKHVLRKWDYPAWIIKKHQWFFNWVLALYQVRFPKYRVTNYYYGYIHETKEKLQSKRRLKISSAQAQVTKYQNKIELLKQHLSGTLFSDYTQHPIYPRLKHKLEENKHKLQQAIMDNVEETI